MRSRLGDAVGWAGAALLLAFLFLPVVVVVPSSLGPSDSLTFPPRTLSLRWYRDVLIDPRWVGSAWLSLRLAAAAALIAASAGLTLGLVHLRFRRVGTGLQLFLLLPALVPHIMLASGLFSLELATHTLESTTLLLLAQAALGVPYATIAVVTAVDLIDPMLWPVASSLGAAWPTIVRRIMLPVLGPALVVAAVFGFQASWDDVSIAAMTGPGVTPTLPVRMYLYLSNVFTPVVAAAATLLLAFSALIGLVARMGQRRMRRAATRRAPEAPPERDATAWSGA